MTWNPGSGDTWQMLGRRNTINPALRVCDFRTAKGVYILYDNYGPTYAGLARGLGGLGARLRTHNTKPPRKREWTRFSWFSFDDIVAATGYHGWEEVRHRSKPVPAQSETVIREMEALLIKVLGTRQNKMSFQNANEWEQLWWHEAANLRDKELVDPRLFTAKLES
ncbi:GIY-YIG nuclease family protein [Nocardioides anomalus]|uniref:GIY-YIG nuclease family protein n=1 Tax=Nocardioides anomalus TaxID=2712223 RepID=A0A6G6WA10_9ACTN|nr:GIY-YIG nuclease family protein [Nocardioides anomalus]QIG42039.1 GIY-YIG nuclease family protein [Nocardioides anomalus]